MNSPTPVRRQSGFTLMEIILTLLVLGVVGSLLFEVFGSSFVGSLGPVTEIQNAFGLEEAMEEMTDDCLSGTALTTLQARIGARVYGDGNYTVDANSFVTFDSNKNVVADAGGGNDTLRVTISRATGESLTTLFTAQ